MELIGYISVTIQGKTPDGNLNPKDIDIAETKELLSDVETLLFPTKPEKDQRPKVSYDVQEGSVKNMFYTPISKVIMFTALMSEVEKQGNLEILDVKAAKIIDKWQKKVYHSGRQYLIASSTSDGRSFFSITKETQFISAETTWVDTSLYVYGKIYEEGGLNNINLHIVSDRYGKLPVKATEEQLTSGENKLFKVYGLWVKGKQNIKTGELLELELIDFLRYERKYDDIALQSLIKKATINWKDISDKDAWLNEIRGGIDE
jgi:hypothetical protein